MDESANQSSLESAPERKRNGMRVPFYIPTIVWLMVIFFIGVLLGNLLWLGVADVLAFGREKQNVELTIEAQDQLSDIANKLADGGLLSYPRLFRLYARLTNAGQKIKPGTYVLNTGWDYPALVSGMSR